MDVNISKLTAPKKICFGDVCLNSCGSITIQPMLKCVCKCGHFDSNKEPWKQKMNGLVSHTNTHTHPHVGFNMHKHALVVHNRHKHSQTELVNHHDLLLSFKHHKTLQLLGLCFIAKMISKGSKSGGGTGASLHKGWACFLLH